MLLINRPPCLCLCCCCFEPDCVRYQSRCGECDGSCTSLLAANWLGNILSTIHSPSSLPTQHPSPRLPFHTCVHPSALSGTTANTRLVLLKSAAGTLKHDYCKNIWLGCDRAIPATLWQLNPEMTPRQVGGRIIPTLFNALQNLPSLFKKILYIFNLQRVTLSPHNCNIPAPSFIYHLPYIILDP